MNKIERYLDQVCKGLGGSSQLCRHLRDELREDLHEAVEQHKAAGLSEPDAIDKTLEEFGEPTAIHDGLKAVYGHRTSVSVMIEKAMQWRESTMKTGWKWNFVGMFFLTLVILIQVIYFYFIAWKLMPRAMDIAMHNPVDTSQLPSMIPILRLYDFVPVGGWLLLTFLAVVTGWIVFERRAQSDYKPAIRMAVGALIALILSVINIVITGMIIVWEGFIAANLLK